MANVVQFSAGAIDMDAIPVLTREGGMTPERKRQLLNMSGRGRQVLFSSLAKATMASTHDEHDIVAFDDGMPKPQHKPSHVAIHVHSAPAAPGATGGESAEAPADAAPPATLPPGMVTSEPDDLENLSVEELTAKLHAITDALGDKSAEDVEEVAGEVAPPPLQPPKATMSEASGEGDSTISVEDQIANMSWAPSSKEGAPGGASS